MILNNSGINCKAPLVLGSELGTDPEPLLRRQRYRSWFSRLKSARGEVPRAFLALLASLSCAEGGIPRRGRAVSSAGSTPLGVMQTEHGHPECAGDVAPAALPCTSHEELQSPGARRARGAGHLPPVSAAVVHPTASSLVRGSRKKGAHAGKAFEVFIPAYESPPCCLTAPR